MARNKDSVSWYSSAVSRSETTIQSPMDTPAIARIYRTERGNARPTYNQHEKVSSPSGCHVKVDG